MTPAAAPIHVLLIEDDEDDYLLTRALLTEIDPHAYRLTWAHSYQDGLQQLQLTQPDVCLLDHRLGPHTGLELLHEARARGTAPPFIMLTGMANREADLESMRAGASDYLIKSGLDAAQLERAIRYALEERRREQERDQLDEARRARIEAEAASRAKDEVLATVSHELRNPLSAILGWAQVLLKDDTDPVRRRRAAEAIQKNAQLQKQLIDDLLDVARSSSGKLTFQGVPVDLNAVAAAVIDSMRLSVESKELTLECMLPPGRCEVIGDPERLQQVFWNLLSNAVRHTPHDGRVSLQVSCDDRSVSIEVADTGEGISPEFLPFVFDRFSQERSHEKGRQSGLGLGLALVRTIVEAHGGSVTAISEGKGRGARFIVQLPMRSAAVAT